MEVQHVEVEVHLVAFWEQRSKVLSCLLLVEVVSASGNRALLVQMVVEALLEPCEMVVEVVEASAQEEALSPAYFQA